MTILESLLGENFLLLNETDISLGEVLLGCGQAHLYKNWPSRGCDDALKRMFLDELHEVDSTYPSGLVAYVAKARTLLADAVAGRSAFDSCTPEQPDTVDCTRFDEAYLAAERTGFAAFAQTAVVLVAGGLGERLGYSGIKLDIPVEVTQNTTYFEHYTSVLREASRRLGCAIPLVIMTSRNTHEITVERLRENHFFGLGEENVTLLRQGLVPALSDVKGRIAISAPCRLVLKPHGHGDIHTLMHTSGTAARLAKRGIEHLLFIQDTNGQVFNAAFAALGVSVQRDFDFNSVAVPRVPGEAIGALARLRSPDAPDLTLNIEYNLLDPLLRATVDPRGDVANEKGLSSFPGNINVLVVRLATYLRILDASGGVVPEFINPKFANESRQTFNKPTRIESLMQDLPRFFNSGEKVGVTTFDRAWCFSACKNEIGEAAKKYAIGSPPESASSAESDFYAAGRTKLAFAGMHIEETPPRTIAGIAIVEGPRVILRPSFALTLDDVRQRIRGGEITGDATLILDGDVRLDCVTIPSGTSLVASAPEGKSISLRQTTIPASADIYCTVPLKPDEDAPETLRIRGYKISKNLPPPIDTETPKWSNRGLMRLLVPLIAVTVFGLTSCCCPMRYCKEDKLETRKDLWGPTEVEGPYTRMLKRGIPKPSSPFDAPADTAAANKSVRPVRGK